MAKIPELNVRGAISDAGGSTGGFANAFDSQGERQGIALQKMSQALGRVSDVFLKFQDTQDELEVSNTNLTIKKDTMEMLKDLSVRKEGDAEDGSDLPYKSQDRFNELRSGILEKASNGRVRKKLNESLNQVEASFGSNVAELIGKRKADFLENSFDKFSNESANLLYSTKGVESRFKTSKESQGELDRLLLQFDDVGQREKVKQVHDMRLRSAMVDAVSFDKYSAEETLAAVKGKSKNAGLNELFKSSSLEEKSKYLNKLDQEITQRDNKSLREYGAIFKNFESRASIGDVIYKEEYAQAKSLLLSNRSMGPNEKERALQELDIVMKVSDKMNYLVTAETKDLLNYNAEKEIPFDKNNAPLTLGYKNELQKAVTANLKLRAEKPVDYIIDNFKEVDVAYQASFDSSGRIIPEKFQNYRFELKSKLEALGMPTDTVLNNQMALSHVKQVMLNPDDSAKAVELDYIIKSYGEDAPAAMTQMRNMLAGDDKQQKKFSQIMTVAHFADKKDLLDSVTNENFANPNEFVKVFPGFEKKQVDDISKRMAKTLATSDYAYFSKGSESGLNFFKDLVAVGQAHQRKLISQGMSEEAAAIRVKREFDKNFVVVGGGKSAVLMNRNDVNGKPTKINAYNKFLIEDAKTIPENTYQMSPKFLKDFQEGNLTGAISEVVVRNSMRPDNYGSVDLVKIQDSQKAFEYLIKNYGIRIKSKSGNGFKKVIFVNGEYYDLKKQDGSEDIVSFEEVEKKYGK